MFWAQLTLTGFAQGAILSLAAMGVVLTYKATGIFNFAHGAIAVFVAYVFFQMNQEWGLHAVIAGPVAILVVAPLVGLVLEWLVFRPLQRAGATTTEKLVATLGAFVMILGAVIAIWTGATRPGANLFSPRGFDIFGLRMGYHDLGNIVLLAAISGALWFLFQHTHLGIQIRAVVDRRELAELAGINANRVSGIAWAMGTTLSGLAGVLLANLGSLNPVDPTLTMIGTFSLVVVARLTSIPIAVASGVLLLGVGDALFEQITLFDGRGLIGQGFDQLKPNLSVILLFGALIVYRSLDVVGEASERSERLAAPTGRSGRRATVTAVVVGAGLLILPLFLDSNGFDRAHSFLAFAIIFVSIVAVTGFSGQITLGQAGFAGIGAWGAARIANSLDVPVIIATVLGGLVALVAGLAAGWPALRRRGLFLALTTLALNLLIFSFILTNTAFAGGVNGLQVVRPSLFGLDLGTEVGFYFYELAWLAITFFLARNLRSGRLGRALGAMRDSEDGARSVGIDLRAYKLFIFGASAFMAGIGGTLLTQQAEVFTATGQFFPLQSLFWFAVVVVAGVSSIAGALLGAFIWVMLEILIGVEGVAQLLIGLAALFLGRLPGGSLMGLLRVGRERVVESGRRALAESMHPPAEPDDGEWVPTELAERLLADNRADGARRVRRLDTRRTRPVRAGAGPSTRGARR